MVVVHLRESPSLSEQLAGKDVLCWNTFLLSLSRSWLDLIRQLISAETYDVNVDLILLSVLVVAEVRSVSI